MAIKHIVFWNLKPEIENKEEIALQIKNELEALNGKIDGLISLKIGIDFSKTEMSADIALDSEFVDVEALNNYAIHPLHVAAAGIVRSNTHNRRVVDFVI